MISFVLRSTQPRSSMLLVSSGSCCPLCRLLQHCEPTRATPRGLPHMVPLN